MLFLEKINGIATFMWQKVVKSTFFSRLFNYNNKRYFLSGFLKPFAAKNGTHVAKNHMVSWHKDFLLWPLYEKKQYTFGACFASSEKDDLGCTSRNISYGFVSNGVTK